jgi:hypothetical protein
VARPQQAHQELELPPPVLSKAATCPNTWCQSGAYRTFTGDDGKRGSYCVDCSFES